MRNDFISDIKKYKLNMVLKCTMVIILVGAYIAGIIITNKYCKIYTSTIFAMIVVGFLVWFISFCIVTFAIETYSSEMKKRKNEINLYKSYKDFFNSI